MNSHKGEPTSMNHNSSNGVICIGHSYGGISMWTPNFGKPVV